MGRSFESYDSVDYPNLNKCPDCETFFADETCPLCGKVCPEEMRAGNRKPVKQKKRKRGGNDTGRVQFVPWYFNTVFIIAMLVIQPIIGLILTWMGPWKRVWKIVATLAAIFPYIGGVLIAVLIALIGSLVTPSDALPVNLDIPQTEYVEMCEAVDIETLYRNVDTRVGEYVTLTLTVDGIWNDEYEYESEYATYLECSATDTTGREWNFLVRDWRQGNTTNFAVGDTITVWGQVAGDVTIHNYTAGTVTAPGIHMLYAELR